MLKTCRLCGKEFTTKHGEAKYCGRECVAQALSKKQLIVCPVCGAEVLVRNGHQFCGSKCANTFRRKANYRERFSLNCIICGKQFNTVKANRQTCSAKCTRIRKDNILATKYPSEVVEAMHTDPSAMFRYMWSTAEFREQVHNRMCMNNPVYQPGVVERAMTTKSRRGYIPINNFKYGNGKISEYEGKVYDRLCGAGFIYNYAINTKIARDAFPDVHYAYAYKPDFVHLANHICVEIDGKDHQSPRAKARDLKKSKCLEFMGFKVIRFTHSDIDNGEFDKWLDLYLKDM